MYAIRQIEDAIIAALQASSLNEISPTISSYHGEIDDLVKEAAQLLVPMPAAFVLYAGSTFETKDQPYDDEPLFTIVLVAQSLRGGDGPGGGMDLRAAIYPMIEAVKSALKGSNLGLANIALMRPVRIDPTLITKTFSIYSFDWQTCFSMD